MPTPFPIAWALPGRLLGVAADAAHLVDHGEQRLLVDLVTPLLTEPGKGLAVLPQRHRRTGQGPIRDLHVLLAVRLQHLLTAGLAEDDCVIVG